MLRDKRTEAQGNELNSASGGAKRVEYFLICTRSQMRGHQGIYRDDLS